MKARSADFAGSWYPSQAAECEREIHRFLDADTRDRDKNRKYRVGIVPHAGWYYSGQIACTVIRELSGYESPDIIAILGMHLPPSAPNVLMASGAWETPFGPLEIAAEFAAELADAFSFRIETVSNYTPDNTIELQLPFVKYFFESARILPVGLPPTRASLEVAIRLVEIAAAQNQRLRVIGSTDLTHYGSNYGFSPQGTGPKALEWVRSENDRKIIASMLAMDPEGLIDEAQRHNNACCAGAAAGAVAAAQTMGARKAEQLAYATSHDKSPGDNFVGYVGVVFE